MMGRCFWYFGVPVSFGLSFRLYLKHKGRKEKKYRQENGFQEYFRINDAFILILQISHFTGIIYIVCKNQTATLFVRAI